MANFTYRSLLELTQHLNQMKNTRPDATDDMHKYSARDVLYGSDHIFIFRALNSTQLEIYEVVDQADRNMIVGQSDVRRVGRFIFDPEEDLVISLSTLSRKKFHPDSTHGYDLDDEISILALTGSFGSAGAQALNYILQDLVDVNKKVGALC